MTSYTIYKFKIRCLQHWVFKTGLWQKCSTNYWNRSTCVNEGICFNVIHKNSNSILVAKLISAEFCLSRHLPMLEVGMSPYLEKLSLKNWLSGFLKQTRSNWFEKTNWTSITKSFTVMQITIIKTTTWTLARCIGSTKTGWTVSWVLISVLGSWGWPIELAWGLVPLELFWSRLVTLPLRLVGFPLGLVFRIVHIITVIVFITISIEIPGGIVKMSILVSCGFFSASMVSVVCRCFGFAQCHHWLKSITKFWQQSFLHIFDWDNDVVFTFSNFQCWFSPFGWKF